MAVAIGALLALAFLVAVVVAAQRYGAVDNALWRWCYKRYLRSWRWQDTKMRVGDLDGFYCQECHKRIMGGVWDCHHLRYRRAWFYFLAPLLGLREDAADLVTLCQGCHRAVHAKELEP